MTASSTPAPAPSPTRGIAPFLAPLHREFDRMLGEFGGFDLTERFGPSPRMDLREIDGGLELTVELPGLKEDDVRIEVQDDVLTVSGEKKSATESHDKGLRVVERRYGAFSRSVRLPAGVKADAIKAGLDQGVLTVTVPLDGQAADRKVRIPVKSA